MPVLAFCSAAFAAAASLVLAPVVPLPQQTPTPLLAPDPQAPTRFEKQIVAFETADAKTPPPAHPTLFVGSSSMVMWKTLAKDFPDVTLLNRGFGGSTIYDVLYYTDRAVLPYKPSRIVFYAGDNDLSMGRTPARVRNDFVTFVEKVRAVLPNTPIYYLAIKPSPSRWSLRDKINRTNQLIRDYATYSEGAVTYVDIYTPMLAPNGQPRPELFLKDNLHMNAEGYRIWTDTLKPYLAATPAQP